MTLQIGEKKLSGVQQTQMYWDIVERETNQLAHKYMRIVEETKNCWPTYKDDCITAALSVTQDKYGTV